jgi:hypothetical protein
MMKSLEGRMAIFVYRDNLTIEKRGLGSEPRYCSGH